MKVILLERVERLGAPRRCGQRQGRLRPQLPAAPLQGPARHLRQHEGVRGPARRDREPATPSAREAAAKAGAELDGSTYVMIRQAGETGQLYGSVSGRDVADAVNAEGGQVDRSMVVLDKPIKTLGVHQVKVRLHAEVTGHGEHQHRPQRRTRPSARPAARTSSPRSSRKSAPPTPRRRPTCSKAAPEATKVDLIGDRQLSHR